MLISYIRCFFVLFFILNSTLIFSQNCNNLSVSAGSDTSICFGDSIELGGSPTASWNSLNPNPNVTYTYLWSANVVNGSIPNPTNSPSIPTTYSVVVIADPGFPNGLTCTDTAFITVTVLQLPTLSLSQFAEACENDSPFILSGGSPTPGDYSGNGVIGGTSFNPSLANIGTNTITYSYTDNNLCSNTITEPLVVNPLPSVSFSNSNLDIICIDEGIVTLSGGLPSSGTYFGTGVNNNTFDPSIANIGSHTIWYTYTNPNNGCSDSASHTITVTALPIVSFLITNPTQVCSNENPFQLSGGSPSIGNGIYSGDGVIGGTIFNPSLSSIGNNTITYTYTDLNGCSNTSSQTITVLQAPLPSTFFDFGTGVIQTAFIWDPNNIIPFTTCYSVGNFLPLHLTLSNTSSTANTDSIYEINWGDGSAIYTTNGLQFQGIDTLHTYSSTGAFNLTLVVTGQNECLEYDTISVFLGNTPEVSLENPGGLNFCATNEITFPITGTDDNPSGTIYTISTNTGDPDYIFPHPPDSSYTHIFDETSCGALFSNGNVSNFFTVNILAVNACGNGFNPVGPINVSSMPEANINISPTDSVACLNSIVSFSNISIDGSTVSGGTDVTPSNCFFAIAKSGEPSSVQIFL